MKALSAFCPIGDAVPSPTPRCRVNSRSVVKADIEMASSRVVASPAREIPNALHSCWSSSFSLATMARVFISTSPGQLAMPA